MQQGTELLNYLYQNSQMGITAIEQLANKVEDKDFSNQLHLQQNAYQAINQAAADQLYKRGQMSGELTKTTPFGSYMKNYFPAHISQMMIMDSLMGITDITKNIEKHQNADTVVKSLTVKLIETEQSCIDTFKSYL